MLRRFFDDPLVGLTQRILEVREHSLRFGSFRVKKPT